MWLYVSLHMCVLIQVFLTSVPTKIDEKCKEEKKAARVWKQYKLERHGAVSKRIWCGVSGLVDSVPERWTDNRGRLEDVLVSAPSAGRRRVASHLPSTSRWLGQHTSRLTAQHDATKRVRTAGGGAWRTRHYGAFSQRTGRVASLSLTYTNTNTQCHTLPQIPVECAAHTHTHKLCSHPPLPLIQCSNSTLFCNTVTQSHQLFIADFCTCSVVGLIDTEEGIQGWRG